MTGAMTCGLRGVADGDLIVFVGAGGAPSRLNIVFPHLQHSMNVDAATPTSPCRYGMVQTWTNADDRRRRNFVFEPRGPQDRIR